MAKILKRDILSQEEDKMLVRWRPESKLQFKLLPANREIDNSHSRKLKKLILKHGMLSTPLVVSTKVYNKKHQTKPQLFILDGQNRIKACMDNNIPFNFYVKDIDNITGLEFNNSQKNFQYGSGNNNDFYYFTGISLSYIFYKIPCPKNSAPYNSIY